MPGYLEEKLTVPEFMQQRSFGCPSCPWLLWANPRFRWDCLAMPPQTECPRAPPSLMSPEQGAPGNGLLLILRVDNFVLALQRARSLVGSKRSHTSIRILEPRSS